MNIFKKAGELEEKNIPFALATIIEAKGSTPRNSAKMIIKEDGSIIGTIGGGLAEAYIIEEGVKVIKNKESKIVEYKLNSSAKDGIHMLCGGNLRVFIEVIASRPKLMIIGGGHVGYALARLAEFINYEVIVVDDREEFANFERYPMAKEISTNPDISKAIEEIDIDEDTYIVIATKDSDEKALRKVIDSNAAYIGMIGSKRKVSIIMKNLQQDNYDKERLDFVHSPIGLDIGSETPEEIAVSILSEIMKVKSGKTGHSNRELMKG